MENLLLALGCCFFGIAIGYLLPRVKQKTVVKISNDNVSFRSNRLQNGDQYQVFIDDKLVGEGNVVEGQWA